MGNSASRYEIDMCNGPQTKNMLRFAIPLAISSILQLAFNAADMIVLGQCAGDFALAAVGATASLINLIIAVFNGISVGANVLLANFRGAKKPKDVSEALHTAMAMALLGGVILLLVGTLLSRPMLKLMGTSSEIIDQSVLYMRIYFCGMPFFMVYTFGSAVMRAIGDTKRPMFFLLLSGVLNVVLNLFFVLLLHMDVDGVAIATVASQALSAVLVTRCLIRYEGDCHLNIRKLRLYKSKTISMIRLGLPAGLQGSLFSVSNVLIQSSINTFDTLVVSGNTAAINIEHFVTAVTGSIQMAATSFTSQNYGAKKYKNITSIAIRSVLIVTVMGASIGLLVCLFGKQLLGLYTNSEEVIQYGLRRIYIMCPLFFIGGIQDALCGVMRGMGRSFVPMIVSLTGICLLRIIWIYTVFAWYPTQTVIYLSYPITWSVTAIAYTVYFIIVRKKLLRTQLA